MSGKREVIARDKMYTLSRSVDAVDLTTAEKMERLASHLNSEIPFDEWLRSYLLFIDQWLEQINRPRATARVVVAQDEWLYLDDLPPAKQRGHQTTGCDYLLEREKPLTLAWWLATLADHARMALAATDPSHKLHRALALGEERERFKSHRLFLDRVTLGAKTAPIRKAQSQSGNLRLKDDTGRIIKKMDELLRRNSMRRPNWAATTLARSTLPDGTTKEIKSYADRLRKRYEYHKKKGGEE